MTGQPYPAPAVIPLSSPAQRKMFGALGVVLLAAGAWQVVMGIGGSTWGYLVGIPFILLGVVFCSVMLGAGRRLTVDSRGVRNGGKKAIWAFEWGEVGGVQLTVATYKAMAFMERIPGFGSGRLRLIVLPTDPGFADRHPELKLYAGRFGAPPGGYGLALGTERAVVPALDGGLRAFGGPRYLGAIDEGNVSGIGLG